MLDNTDGSDHQEGLVCTVCHQHLDNTHIILPECKQPHPYCHTCATTLLKPRSANKRWTPASLLGNLANLGFGGGPTSMTITGPPSIIPLFSGMGGQIMVGPPHGENAAPLGMRRNPEPKAEDFTITCVLCEVIKFPYSFSQSNREFLR